MRLICFGDSWTAGHGVEDDVEFKEDPNPNDFIVNFRNNNSYPRWLSDKFNKTFINMGVAGYGNLDILNRITPVVENDLFNYDDVIIIQFSYPHRYRKTKQKNDPNFIFEELEKILSSYTHFYFNGFYPLFKDESNKPDNFPDYYIEPDNTLANVLKKYEIENDESVWEYGSRSIWNDQQNFWEGDYHPNLKGYKLIADYIYDSIKEKV